MKVLHLESLSDLLEAELNDEHILGVQFVGSVLYLMDKLLQ